MEGGGVGWLDSLGRGVRATLGGTAAALRAFFTFSPILFDRDSRLPNGGWPEGSQWSHGTTGPWHSVPAAYAAVSVLAQTMAMLPARVVVSSDDGAPVPVENSPVAALLENPSSVLDPWQFWENFWRAVFTHGNAFAWIRRVRGQPVELIPCVQVGARWAASSRRRQVIRKLVPWAGRDHTAGFEAADADVIAVHWAAVDLHEMVSPSPISIATHTIRVMTQAAAHNEATLRQGLHSRGLIRVNPDLSAKNWEDLKVDMAETWTGLLNAGKTPLLPLGAEWQSMGGFSAVDLQLLQLMRFGVEEISRIFGVPPRLIHLFSEGKKVESARYTHLAADFERHTIAPHARRAGAQLTRKLLPGSAEQRIVLDTRQVRSGSLDELAEVVNLLVARSGVWKVDEGRAILGFGPLPDGSGNRTLQPTGAPTQRRDAGGSE